MMNKNKFFKVFAVANFVILIVVFLLYRNGTFDSETSKSIKKTEKLSTDKSENIKSQKNDTVEKTEPREDDSKSPMTKEGKEVKKIHQMIYSSKSVIVADPQTYEQKPSVITEEKAPNMMYSSKSGIIYSPKKKDTVKKNP